MDYEKQVQAFERRMMKNPWELSRMAQVLWYRLNNLARIEGKTDGIVSVDGVMLARLMGATEKTFFTARTELEEKEFISHRPGVKASPSQYFIKQLN